MSTSAIFGLILAAVAGLFVAQAISQAFQVQTEVLLQAGK